MRFVTVCILLAFSAPSCLHWPKEPEREIPERAKQQTLPPGHKTIDHP